MIDMTVANTILQQLGGNKFKAMTGASGFIGSANSLSFKIGRNREGINSVTVKLEDSDTYTVEFCKLRKYERRIMATFTSVYAEDLRKLFTNETGLETSL